jgi:glucose-1-phosphate adenylyltransferase
MQAQDFGYDTVNKVVAIVLGGGRGTRLYPLTKLRAKPAVPLCGRYRLIDIPLSNCIHSGIECIFVLTQFNSHSLHRHIANTYKFDPFSPGHVTLLAAEQTNETGDWFQGTADAVRKHLMHIHDLGVEHYVILSGDQLYAMDYRMLLSTHLKQGADITVSALPVDRESARGFGIMKVQKDGRIRQFVEKPRDEQVLDDLITHEKLFHDFDLDAAGKPYLASMGVYVFKAKVLERLLCEHPEWIDFGKELLPGALKTHKLFAHMFSGFWEDIGTVRSYFDVSMAITSLHPPYHFHDPKWMVYTHARALPGVTMYNTRVNNAIICEGSRISHAVINDAIIGIRSIIHDGVTIEKSIILGADYYESETRPEFPTPIGIGAGSRITNAIIDHNAHIGSNVFIKGSRKLKDYEGDGYSIRDGIVVVHKNGVIPDGTVIG